MQFPVKILGGSVNLFDQVTELLLGIRGAVSLDHKIRILDLIRVLYRDEERLVWIKDVRHVEIGEYPGDLHHFAIAPCHL